MRGHIQKCNVLNIHHLINVITQQIDMKQNHNTQSKKNAQIQTSINDSLSKRKHDCLIWVILEAHNNGDLRRRALTPSWPDTETQVRRSLNSAKEH